MGTHSWKMMAAGSLVAVALATAPAGAQSDTKEVTQDRGGVEFPHGGDELVWGEADTCNGQTATIKATEFGVTYGTGGSDVIVGTDGNDVIHGLGGNDVICGFDGDDIIYGDHDDPLDSSGGLDTINGGEGDDDIYGGPRQDFLQGSAGRDVIWGDLPTSVYGVQDNIEGGNGNDTIIGGPGSDLVWGDRKFAFPYEREQGYGNDVIDAVTDDPTGHDEVWGGRGNDYIYAKDNDGQNVWAGSGNDTCALDLRIDLYTSCETIL